MTTTVCNTVSLRRWGVLVLVDDRQPAQGKNPPCGSPLRQLWCVFGTGMVCRCPTVSVIPSTTSKWMHSLSDLCVFFNKNAFKLNWFFSFYENFKGKQTVNTFGQVAQTYLTCFLGNLPSKLVALVVATLIHVQYHFGVQGSSPVSSRFLLHAHSLTGASQQFRYQCVTSDPVQAEPRFLEMFSR